MAFSIKPLLVSLATVSLASACASPAKMFSKDTATEIFYKDGRTAYVATCTSANWGSCLEKAGMTCKNAGYTILEKNSRWTSDGDEKELIVACKAKAETTENKP